MSQRAFDFVWEKTDLTAATKMVALAIAARTPCITDACFKINERDLMARSGASRSQLVDAFAELDRRAYLAARFHQVDEGGPTFIIGGFIGVGCEQTPEFDSEPSRDWTEKRAKVLAKSNGACFYCGMAEGESRLELDHMHPQSRGGKDGKGLANLVGACRACNREKRDRTFEEYRDLRAKKLGVSRDAVRFYGETLNTEAAQ